VQIYKNCFGSAFAAVRIRIRILQFTSMRLRIRALPSHWK